MALEAKHIWFRYHKKQPWILQDVSLTVKPGERLAVTAPSGYGKTTLALLLAGYLTPEKGEILTDGQPLPAKGLCPVQLIHQHPEHAINPRWRLRRVLDESRPLRRDPAGALRAPSRAAHTGPARRPLSRATHADPDALQPPSQAAHTGPDARQSLSPAAHADPDALHSDLIHALGIEPAWLDRFPRELSGGELQRFCVARALLSGADYLICDEVSTMLDVITQAQIWNVILGEAAKRNMGIIAVTHNPYLAERIATRIVDLSEAGV